MPWLKGNTHTHTDRSDGDAPLDAVAGWYASHGYDFLVITDHNGVTDVGGWNRVGDTLLLIPGCEVSAFGEGKPVHVNSLGSAVLPDRPQADTIAALLQREVDAVRAAGGVPQVNHPNYRWAFTDLQLSSVENYHLLEVFNASAECNNFGGGGWPGVEEIWDRLLTAGRRVWAVASDDAHHFRGEWWGHRSPPGRAWVVVRAAERSAGAVLEAMERGDFYASTEVTLEAVHTTDDAIALQVAAERDFRYTTHFIGSGGRTLAVVHGEEAVYRLRGDEGYVRAKVFSSNGGVAWTQPAFVG
ncbi:MAG: CehA/McbA family metallohydrolase [Armatimonadota bacterium]|nr:CehA/McbA family metallohydrolase [Armatimonadota bacterium]